MTSSIKKSDKSWKIWGTRLILTTVFGGILSMVIGMYSDIEDLKAGEPVAQTKMESMLGTLNRIDNKVEKIHWHLTKGSSTE